MRHLTITPATQYLIRIDRGEEVVEQLTAFCRDNNIHSGSLHGIGASDKIELAHYSVKTKEYSRKTYTGEHEITNVTGVITDDKIHLHATIANSSFETAAGHLVAMQISGACEIRLFAGKEAIKRTYNDETGLELLDV